MTTTLYEHTDDDGDTFSIEGCDDGGFLVTVIDADDKMTLVQAPADETPKLAAAVALLRRDIKPAKPTRDVEGECMFDAADCPLHNDTSQHAEDDEGPAAAAPLGAGPVQMQRIREGLDAWASKLLADRSDETVEAAVRALWLYRDTLPQAETPSDHLEKTIRHEEGQADNVPSAPHGGPDGDEFGEDDDPPPGYEVRSIHDKHAGGYTEQARLEEWEGERHTYRSDAVAEAWAHARNSAAALERIAGAPQGEARADFERWKKLFVESFLQAVPGLTVAEQVEALARLMQVDPERLPVVVTPNTLPVSPAGTQGEAAGPPGVMPRCPSTCDGDRCDRKAGHKGSHTLGSTFWIVDDREMQDDREAAVAVERHEDATLIAPEGYTQPPASPHQGSAESASAPARPSAMAASWWPTTVDRIECDDCGEPFRPYDQVRPVAWAHVECPETERPEPPPGPRKVVARVTATVERVIPPITPEPHQGSAEDDDEEPDTRPRCESCDEVLDYDEADVGVTVVRGYYCPSGCKPSEPHQGSGTAEPAVLFDEDGAATDVVPKVGDRVAAWRGFADDDSDAGWRADMVKCIGCAGTVGDLAKDGTALVALVAFDNGDKWWWLCAALRPTSEPGEGGAS
jgi:hypothetical protein